MSVKSQTESEITKTLGVGHASNRGRRWNRWLLAILLLVGIAVVVIMRRNTNPSGTTQFETQKAQRGDLVVLVTATGTLQPTNTVEVGSEISGIVKTVGADYNDKVKVGQLLARIDTSKIEAQATQSQAALESAKAKVLQTLATVSETRSKLTQLQQVRELSKGKVPSQSEMDAAQASFERAKADNASASAAVAQAEATLKAIQTDIAKAEIRSPIDGVVLTRSIEPGQTVAASFQSPVLFTLAEDLTRMELHVDVDEADIGKVKEGQDATFAVDAYIDRVFKATITQTRFGSKTVDGVVTYETVLLVDNSDLALRPGMTATADITVQKVQDAVLVPSAALRFTPPVQAAKAPSRGLLGAMLPHPPMDKSKLPEKDSGNGKQKKVWVLKEGLPVAVPVIIGVTNGALVEIVTGDITPGTAVVVDVAPTGT
jgi:HlyD family secretion protein